MSVEIREVKTRQQLRTFIHLPAKIHKNHKNWIPPIYMDDWGLFDPKKSRHYRYNDVVMYLAYKDGKPVGRILGIIPHKYNKEHNENNARFAFLETYNDEEVFHMLLKAVEDWARKKGTDYLVGPLGFTDEDQQGFMIEGFDQPPIISANLNFPYMPELLEKQGYTKKYDLVVYQVPIPDKLPENYNRIYNWVITRNKSIKILEFKTKRELKPYIKPVLKLVNETFADIYAFVPFSEDEMEEFAKLYLPILDPEFIKAVQNDKGEIIAFIIGMPDISEGIRKSRGYILPFGFIHILRAQKKTDMLTLLLGGIKKEYRGIGLDVVLGYHMFKSAIKRGFKTIDSHLELEENKLVRREMERMGGRVYKRYRVYHKKL